MEDHPETLSQSAPALDDVFGPVLSTAPIRVPKDIEILKLQFTQGIITIYLVLTGVVCIYIAGSWPTFRERRRHLAYLMLIFALSCCFALYKMGTAY